MEMDPETNFLQSSDQCGANMLTELLLSHSSPLLDFTRAHPGVRDLSTTWLGGMFSQQNLSEDSSQSRYMLSCIGAEHKTYIQEEWFTLLGKWDRVNCLTGALESPFESQKTCDDSGSSHPNT